MTQAQPETWNVKLLGVGFAVLFTVALTAMLGDLVGAFADSSTTFAPYFDSSVERLRHALGAYLLTGSGLAFVAFVAHATRFFETSEPRTDDGRAACLASAVFAAQVGLAAAAFATVSLSVGFGQITGDPGILEVRELLPQLGYVILFVPAALSAGLAVFLLARGASRTAQLPRWLIAAGYVAASAQLLSLYTLPLLLLPLWVVGASVTLRPVPIPKAGG